MGAELRDRERERGSSLVEMLVTSVIVVTLLVALLSATMNHSRQRRLNGERNLALVAAMNTLEQARTIPYANLPSLNGTGFDVPGPNGQPRGLNALPGDADGLPGSIAVVLDLSYGGAQVYRVTARVDWKGIQDKNRIELSSLIVERKQ
jgi:type II secretory pathway pseudopilin PulG